MEKTKIHGAEEGLDRFWRWLIVCRLCICWAIGCWYVSLCVTVAAKFGAGGGVCGFSGRRHRFVVGSRPPLRTSVGPL